MLFKFQNNLDGVLRLLFATFVFSFVQSSVGFASAEDWVSEWLDPQLSLKRAEITAVIQSSKESYLAIPNRHPIEDFGLSFPIGSIGDFVILRMIHSFDSIDEKRVPVAVLGCGHGRFAIVAMFAGARVDIVDFKEMVTIANTNVFKATKKILGYNATDAKQFYRAYPENLVAEKIPLKSWTKTPHAVILAKNLVHFFTPQQMQLFIGRLYNNVMDGGYILIQSDTPFFNEKAVKFYNKKKKNSESLFPGFAVYSENRLHPEMLVCDPESCPDTIDIKPGVAYPGAYSPENTPKKPGQYFHSVRNLFMIQELEEIFESVGFKCERAFYTDGHGMMVEPDKEPKTGEPSSVFLLLYKKNNLG